MKNKLVIGNSSQIFSFMKNKQDYHAISSRNISSEIFEHEWSDVYLLFAEQRTIYSNDIDYKNMFYEVNYTLTKNLINNLNYKNAIFISTSELWNNTAGGISVNTAFDYNQNYYTDSKYKITNMCLEREDVITLFPYNFNSSVRGENFLFGKVFNSIIERRKIEVGDIDFSRELMHARHVADSITTSVKNDIIGRGEVTNVKSFITELYELNGMDIEDYVKIKKSSYDNKKKINWKLVDVVDYTYKTLIDDYNWDING